MFFLPSTNEDFFLYLQLQYSQTHSKSIVFLEKKQHIFVCFACCLRGSTVFVRFFPGVFLFRSFSSSSVIIKDDGSLAAVMEPDTLCHVILTS